MRTHVPAGYGLIEWVFSLTGMARKMTTTIGCSLTAPATVATATAVQAALFANWKLRLPSAYAFRGTRIYNGNGTSNPPYVELLGSTAGQNTNALLLPPNVTHVVNKVTANSGRHGKGRMYFPGAKEGDPDNIGVIPAGTLATYNASLLALKNAVEAVANIGNLYLLGHDASVGPIQVTALTMRPLVGSQVNRVRKA